MSAVVLDAASVSDEPALSDAELVERFLVANDQTAFAEVVHRHSTVVLGVCRRVLHDSHDIDDVFQATFLVFVKNARRIRKHKSLASWLYGVAYRLSLRVARQKQRRRETCLVDETFFTDNTFEKLTDRHDQQLIDVELNALPERYRLPLVLKYLSGRSTNEIAAELGTTVGAVEGLLKRGKDELRRRLLQRGITLGLALTAIQVTQQSLQAAATESLIESTIQAGIASHTGLNTPHPDLISDQVINLAKTELITMTTATKTAIGVAIAFGGLAIGLGGAGGLSGLSENHTEAAGLITTMSVASSTLDSVGPLSIAADTTLKTLDATGASDAGKLSESADRSQGLKRSKMEWDYKSRSENVIKIETSLTDNTDVAFIDTPLHEAMNYLEDLHHIEIIIDQPALADEGVSTDQSVNLQLSGIKLNSALDLILNPLQLDFIIQNEVMLITTRSKARETFETRVYNTDHLKNLPAKDLVVLIKAMSGECKWQDPDKSGKTAETGGGATSEIGGAISGVADTIVVRQTRRGHEEIIDLLNQLKDQQSKEAAKGKQPK